MIKKRLYENNAIVVIDDGDPIMRSGITEKEWQDIVLYSERANESSQDSKQMYIDLIMDIMDPIAKAKRLEAEAKRIREEEEARKLTYEERVRKRKAVRIADISDTFEYDEKGFTYLKGFKIPMPKLLTEALLDAKYNPNSKYTVESLTNFWRWALLNPNPEARTDLFSWFQTGQFSITSSGMIVAYRCVDIKRKSASIHLEKYVTEQFIKLKRSKKSTSKWYVHQINETSFSINTEEEGSLGNLANLYIDFTTNKVDETTVYTDHHTRTMEIKIGQPVKMDRSLCDADRDASCSRGLMCSPLTRRLVLNN
jgi:hypothetical protein